jgi:hypothetical protein
LMAANTDATLLSPRLRIRSLRLMRRLVLSLSLTFSFSALIAAQSQPRAIPSPSPALPAVADLEPADIEKAISTIQEKYINPAAVTGAELSRATLQGLLDRLGRGALLLPSRGAMPSTPAPFYRQILDNHIGYLRPGELNRSQLQDLDNALRGFAGKKVDAIILDLRGSTETSDYALAAEFAGRFVPKGQPLFELRGPSETPARQFVSTASPSYSGLLVALVDVDTAGTTEVVAAALRHHKAIVIGDKTAGRALDYADVSLPSGKVLHLAVAEATLPDANLRPGQGLVPDLVVPLPREEKAEMFQQSVNTGMDDFVFESDLPHLNEAALIAGTNPEIDAAQSAQQRHGRGEKATLHDPVLQRAVDVVTSIGVYEKQPGRSP